MAVRITSNEMGTGYLYDNEFNLIMEFPNAPPPLVEFSGSIEIFAIMKKEDIASVRLFFAVFKMSEIVKAEENKIRFREFFENRLN